MFSRVGRVACAAIRRPDPRPCCDVLSLVSKNQFCSTAEGSQSPSYKNIEVRTEGHVRIVSINRPEKRNCVNSATAKELYRALISFKSDKEARVGILYGKGGTFCAGYDLAEVAAASRLEDILVPYVAQGQAAMGPSRIIFEKPLIAAVSGYAVAGGLELALMCDLRVAEEDAVFGVFCRRFGVPLMDGGTVRLPVLIGMSHAMDMIITGRPVKAQEALQMGLANRVVPKGKALEEALKLANQIAAFPQACLNTDRRSAYYTTYKAESFASAVTYEHYRALPVLEEAVEGAKRFVEGVGRGGSFDDQDSESNTSS